MGDFKVKKIEDANRAQFISYLLKDIDALELMIENRLFEKGITRMGAEQEFCLVKPDFSPATTALEVLKEINDPHFTTELARYNLEINLDPLEVTGDCFTQCHQQLSALLEKARAAIVSSGLIPEI